MRDLIKVFLFGIVLCLVSPVWAANGVARKTVLVLPDNVVTENAAIDSYIYDSTAEFFANEIITLLNKTDYITSPNVTDERRLLKSKSSYIIPAKYLTSRFKTSYNIDYPSLNKVARINKQRYVLMLTSSIDAENYILRRTFWDFWNIAGATVVDPAYKISTYAVLVDTKNNSVLWSNTFYKTISTVEGRILTRGPSPQTEQLQKIRDYSRMLCPEIAQNVQLKVLTQEEYNKESYKIYYDMANFDNIFTKKYRRWYKEGKKDFDGLKSNTDKRIDSIKESQRARQEKNRLKQEAQMQVKAEQYKNAASAPESKVQPKTGKPTKVIQPLDMEDQSLYEPVNMRRIWRNKLFGDTNTDRPPLRDYDKL